MAAAILTIIMVGVLQTFSLALLQNYGSAGRTQLMYKCQQVAEIIRISQYLGNHAAPGFATTAGIPYPLTNASYTPLPYASGDTGMAFWGPNQANIVEKPNDAYRLYYTIESASGSAPFSVRVSAYPANSPNLPGTGTTAAPNSPYLGKGSRLKVVEYVAQIPTASP